MILSFVEHEHGTPAETSLEALTLARRLADGAGGPVEAVAVGDEASAVADALGEYGVERVHAVAGERLDTYAPEAWGASAAQLVDDLAPEAVVAPGTDRGHEVCAHVGAKRDLPMAANCIAVESAATGEAWELTRNRWGGSLIEHARIDADTKLVTAAEHEFPVEAAGEGADPAVEEFAPDLDDDHFRVRVDRVEESDVEGVPLGEARVVVGGGRGVGGPEDYDQLEELADLLGGAVGASRAAVNEGWRPHDDQIGLTGAKISPDVYIACGISGAVQHMVGCKGAEAILAINTDPEAAIMQKGDYAVVGDLHEVIPALNDAIRDTK
jgi:electron transfer flavoprotein alpha subunit